MPELNDTELRSEEVQEILTKVPNWLIRYGITLIFIMLLGIISASWWIKYPDTLTGNAIISTEVPPLYASSEVSGRIVKLYVKNGESIKEGEPLAFIDNPVPEGSIAYLRAFLDSIDNAKKRGDEYCHLTGSVEVELYEVTSDFLELRNTLANLCNAKKDTYSNEKLLALQNKYNNYQKYLEINAREIELSRLDIKNAKERFLMFEAEYKQGISSKLDYLNAQTNYHQSLKTEESLKKNEIQLAITLDEYKEQISDFIHTRAQQKKEDEKQLKELTERLRNHIVRWDNSYLIKSPISGTVSYIDRLYENQKVAPGDVLMAIIPQKSTYEVILDLPTLGFGKIKEGQKVQIAVDNFPAQEFGTLNGVISGIPTLPKNNVYRVNVALVDGLNSSYNQQLVYQPEMTALGEVITEDLRLTERFFNQIRSILN